MGKKLRVVCSAGAAENTFSSTGLNRFTAEQMLCPMQMTTNACRMEWQKPFITYGAGTITEEQIQEVAKKYSTLLDQNSL
jgi:glutathione-regulated potassium-efflux system ancillary protein KefG